MASSPASAGAAGQGAHAPGSPRAAGAEPVSRRNRLSVLFIVLAVLALQRGTTLEWAHAQSPQGARLDVSAVGLSRHETVAPGATTTVDCRWWPKGVGNADLCAVLPGKEAALLRLRIAYPALSIAIWLGVAAVFLQVLRVPRSARVRSELTWGVAVLGLVALYAVTANAGNALAALSGLELDYLTPGLVLVVTGVVLAILGGWLQREDRA